MTNRLLALTNDRLLRRNFILNLAGWALPAVTALGSIPLLARNLGTARFGLVALTWAAIGVFSIFDFGLGRVLTRLIAERLAIGGEHENDIADLIWSAGWLLLGLTSVLAAIGVLLAPWLVDRLLHVPSALRPEAVGVIRLLSLSIPPLAHGVALRGVLEAGQRFGRVNQLRIPLGVASYAGPLLAIPLGGDARVAVGIIVIARAIYWIAHIPFLSDIAPGASRPRPPTRIAMHELQRVGTWITVSNVISPIIVQGDRLVVATTFAISASGWYGAASEVAMKQWLLSAALAPVLFSAMSAALKTAPERAVELAEQATRISLVVLLPVVVTLVAFAEPGLHWWLGPSYSPDAGSALRWLAIAVYVNAIGHAPYFLLQSGVSARSVGIVHLTELPLYFLALVVGARAFGIRSVAVVWLARMAIDSAVMWTIVYWRMPQSRAASMRVARLAAACLVAVAAAAAWGATRG